MAEPDAGTVSVALAFLRSAHEYRTLELDADLVRAVIQRATERAQQGRDVIDERLNSLGTMHDNTIRGVEKLFTADELERGRIIYGNDNQSWLGMMRCVVNVVRGEAPEDDIADLREEVEEYERENLALRTKLAKWGTVLREIAAGSPDAANHAAAAIGGRRIPMLRSVGERLSRSQVWCHACSKEQELNTYDALNRDKWPQCCDAPMRIESPEEAAENSL